MRGQATISTDNPCLCRTFNPQPWCVGCSFFVLADALTESLTSATSISPFGQVLPQMPVASTCQLCFRLHEHGYCLQIKLSILVEIIFFRNVFLSSFTFRHVFSHSFPFCTFSSFSPLFHLFFSLFFFVLFIFVLSFFSFFFWFGFFFSISFHNLTVHQLHHFFMFCTIVQNQTIQSPIVFLFFFKQQIILECFWIFIIQL